MIPYGKQDISEEDIQAVVDVLKSDFLTQGPLIPAFEKAVTDYCGSKYAFAVSFNSPLKYVQRGILKKSYNFITGYAKTNPTLVFA